MQTRLDLQELALNRDTERSPQLRPRRHWVTRYVIPAGLVLAFCLLVGWSLRKTLFPPTEVTVLPVIVRATSASAEAAPLFKAAGWIEPRPTPLRVAALAPGVVEKLLVVEDQEVEAGEPVAELVKADAQLACDRAEADLALRQAELLEEQAALDSARIRFEQPVHLQAELAAADAELARVETELANLPFALRRAEADQQAARTDFEGKQAAEGVVSGISLQIARSQLESATASRDELQRRDESLRKEQSAWEARRDALRQQLKLLADEVQALEAAKARVQAAQARIAQAKVALAEAELQLNRMTIRAPVAGRVFRLIGHPGARVGSGMTHQSGHDGSTVVTMYRPEMLQVRVDVRFEDIPRVSLQQQVEIDNAALSQPMIGRVLFISSEADIQKNTLQVKVELPESSQVLKPEMLVDVTFLAPASEASSADKPPVASLWIPEQLFESDASLSEQAAEGGSRGFVWVADQSAGQARRVQIETGSRRSPTGLLEVRQGLTPTARLIVSGRERLQAGQAIAVTGEDRSLLRSNVVP